MKLGFVSAILEQSSYEEMMDIASGLGFACVEVACWPQGPAERRYGGVSHIDVGRVLEEEDYGRHIQEYAKKRGWRFLLWLIIPIPWTVTWKRERWLSVI